MAEREDFQDPYQTAPGQNTPGQPAYGTQNQTNQQQQAAYEQVRAAYKRFLGREPSDSEIESHLSGRYDPASVQRAISTVEYSQEAESRRQSQAQPQPPEQTAQTPQGPQAPGATPFTREQRDQLTWGNVGRMEGFEVGSTYGGDTKARNSVKNTFGRIASRYPATPQGLRQAMEDPEFKRAFPNARLIDHPKGDKIDFGGVLSDFESGTPVGVVDVGRSFSGPDQTSQTAWVWQPETTSAASYNRTQDAIMRRNVSTTTQEGQGVRVQEAILNPDGEADPLTQYLAYLRSTRALVPPSTEPPLF